MSDLRSQFRSDAQECAIIIDRINGSNADTSSCGESVFLKGRIPYECASPTRKDGGGILPQETYSRRSWPMKLADVTLVICVIAALTVILTYRVKAQTVTNDLLFDNRSEPIICTNTKQIIEIVKANPRFKEPRQFFGNDARHLSSNVANIIPPADHIVLLPMSDGGTIFAYCTPGNVWLHKRIVLDLAYEKNLNPEVPEEQELPKPKKRSRQPK